MTYIDALHDREKGLVRVVERHKGKRVFNSVKVEHSFYYPDVKGKFLSIHGKKLSKFTSVSSKHFKSELSNFPNADIHEGDIKPSFKVLETHYRNSPLPEVQNASIDIEVDFCYDRGYAPPDDPHQPITAVSINYDWINRLVTLVLAPKKMSKKEAEEICARFPDCILCDTERELLETFYELIEDVDILYTWNGEGFDIPYLVNRTIRVLGKEYTRKFCLWDQFPKEREYERYGKVSNTYDLIGRVHLDYLQLYKKFTYHELHSYKLDSVGEYELGENKVSYDGTLDHLYNNDFEKFIEYNRQDVQLLSNLDKKLRFINLVNTLAHDNCVLLNTTLGTVALTDNAIMLEAHDRGMVVPNRNHGKDGSMQLAGGAVGEPKAGKIHKWIGSVDINSLYPSVIRTLNMSPETLIGQVNHTLTEPYIQSRLNMKNASFADAWNGVFCCLEYTEIMNKTDLELEVYIESERETVSMSAKQVHEWIFAENSNLCISANGTIFKTDIEGIIPGLLTRWYADRKTMQAKELEYKAQISKETDPKKIKELQEKAAYWHQREQARKINLNALYGAVSNAGSKFSDQRIGQSTTLTGRTIAKYMNAKVNDILTGVVDHEGECIAYFDTDSCYFSIGCILDNLKENGYEETKESFIELSESIASILNSSFPEFVEFALGAVNERSKLIKCGREICAISGIFPTKKRYAILVYDNDKDGRLDKNGKPGKLKIMGMDTQRADTPPSIQAFLREILSKVLIGDPEDIVVDFIRNFRKGFRESSPWELGMPKRVNNLSKYRDRIAKHEKLTVPGHVQASLNYNNLRILNNDNISASIIDGGKIIVCALRPNPLKIRSVAYPVDETKLPKWFTTLPFDTDIMEGKLIDSKIDNIIGSLGWNLSISKMGTSFTSLFSLE